MKLNNKGFAISVILYAMVILVMGIMYLLLDIVNDRYRLTKSTKESVVEYINSQGVNTVSSELTEKLATNKVIKTNALYAYSNNYYYYGENPKNYVNFNNELWRIIGVFTINNVKHLKIVRNDYTSLKTSDSNRIINSNIFTYLNNDYYNSLNNDRNLILKTNWYNSEYSPSAYTPYNVLTEERKTPNFVLNNIGLINGSDFAYASPSTYHVNKLDSYSVSINNNWLANTYNYFTMSFNGTKINIVTSTGNIESTDNLSAYVYPCVYLKKDVIITSGIGDITNPYVLSK